MASERQNYYQILGVLPSVSNLEIKRAYRNLVKSLHPDVDHQAKGGRKREIANEEMRKLNEAYETLKDKSRRAVYDFHIGLSNRRTTLAPGPVMMPGNDSDQVRQRYLKEVFHPARQSIGRLLSRYKQQLVDLSQDIYDEQLIEDFERYGDDVERALSKASRNLSKHETPPSLVAAELMMRYSIAQAADGLEEIRLFCKNYDYDHLTMAGNLFRESLSLSKRALQLVR